MIRLFFALLFLWVVFPLLSQSRITLSNNIIVNIQNGGVITIDNTNDNALSAASGGGKVISEGENNAIQWIINTSVGSYTLPFATPSLMPIPLQFSVAIAGVTSSVASIYFSTYETFNDDNTNYPSDVTNMNSNCSTNNGLYVVDRFWRIDAQGYSTKPSPLISFGYNNANNEIAVANTITESKLKAQRFNSTTNSWETPQKLYGYATPSLQTVSQVNVSATDFYKTWTLIDTSCLSIPIALSSSVTNALCAGNAFTVNVLGASNYTLFPNNVTTITNSFVITPSVTTNYTVVGSIGTGTNICLSDAASSQSNFTVAVNALPTASFATTNILCYGAHTGAVATILTSTSAVTYTWSNGSHATTINGLGAGTYTLLMKDVNDCTSFLTASVVQPTSAISLITSAQNPLCYNENNGFANVVVQGGTPNYSYTWQPSGVNTSSLTAMSSGAYTIHVVDANGCKEQSVVYLTQATEALVASIVSSVQPSCKEDNGAIYSTVNGGVAPFNYEWLANSSTTSYLELTSEGIYTLVVTDSYGCKDTLVTLLNCLSPISISQLVTPNADGKNDLFEINGIEHYPTNSLAIYNRWGSLVYEQANYQNSWNGTYHSKKELLPAGTYFVVLQLNDEQKQAITGFVELRY